MPTFEITPQEARERQRRGALLVDIRGTLTPAKVVALPFYKRAR